MRLHVRSLAMKEFVLNWLFESVHVQTAVFGTISVKKRGNERNVFKHYQVSLSLRLFTIKENNVLKKCSSILFCLR